MIPQVLLHLNITAVNTISQQVTIVFCTSSKQSSCRFIIVSVSAYSDKDTILPDAIGVLKFYVLTVFQI